MYGSSSEWLTWLGHPAFPGEIGMTRLPGLRSYTLEEDLEDMVAEGASTLVTLNEARELRRLGIDDFGAEVERAGLAWYHLPIRDFGVPDADFEAAWIEQGPELRQRLKTGERVVLHCYAGLGRTGLVAARLLIEFGELPVRAIALVRHARRGTIQTADQEAYLLRLRLPCRPAKARPFSSW